MMQILSGKQQKYLDQYTIEHEPISSTDLMNRASQVFTDEILQDISADNSLIVLCGTGNNGGDGFVIFRYLRLVGINARCYLVPFGSMSPDCQVQFDLVKTNVLIWNNENQEPDWNEKTIVIDALLGIGSNREPENELKRAIEWINSVSCGVYSVDMPSGLPADELPTHNCIVRATKTFTFHAPKLTFLLPETAEFAGDWKVLDIGLDQSESKKQYTPYELIREDAVKALIPGRKRFSHKGTYGHALLIAGSDGKMGACLLSSEACLRSGIGLLTVHTVSQGKYSLHQRIPEAMVQWDSAENKLSGECLPKLTGFSAIGIGPGLGTAKGTRLALEKVLESKLPCVIDADALNVLAQHPELLEKLHENCILTPHPKEFERLAGSFEDSLERLERAVHFAGTNNCILVLKDAITAVINPRGAVSFNSTGNPGMAKGGSGDVLTGIILGCLAQGIKSFDAARTAVFHHGLAGDKAKEAKGERAMLASDLIASLRIE
ncbi:MAG: bifunctional ADP-dependent NAD(P)H-hydrate dehydratase/NAD(P)H-hydrate epimerase [Fluviicola sp.]|jgi:NAD(P)H-hydrate epimerase|uniref:NAD(P)H-hydrate dehydratase n=1 Tax=Fluviicola sp. TaxID=1917219 RepID=UPI0026158DC4|nr:NAD(P)H-hydrate dehydratase [Fluviicola sp.]MDF3026225.1 bifunctional ADP-dependent NAD(P)H-hydrate dehydratase/NAD(P)H-hydrate epimerase [Fluviicola sp.]